MAEFAALGMGDREARRLAQRRLGSYSAHRRAALRHLHADMPALLDLAPWRSIATGPLAAPTLVLLAAAVIAFVNPHTRAVLADSISLLPFRPAGHVVRFVPLTPPGAVPMGFANVALWCFALLGMAQVAAAPRLRIHWRVWAFAVSTLLLLVALGGVLWATGLELLMKSRWNSDGLQGLAILAFPFAYLGWAFLTLRLWRRDLLRRCPVCLRRLGLADWRGNGANLLVAPLERETICLHGHGADVESRWRHTFATDRFA